MAAKYIKTYINAGLLAATLALTAGAASSDFVVVVSAKSPVGTLTAEQVSDIFLGKVSNFPSGGPTLPVDQTEGSALRDEFYTKVTSKAPAQLKAYWSKIVFTGKGQPPKEVADSAAVKKLIAENPNTIGYVDKRAVDASVKAVFAF